MPCHFFLIQFMKLLVTGSIQIPRKKLALFCNSFLHANSQEIQLIFVAF